MNKLLLPSHFENAQLLSNETPCKSIVNVLQKYTVFHSDGSNH